MSPTARGMTAILAAVASVATVPAGAAGAASLAIAPGAVSLRHGQLLVHVRCRDGDECAGSLRAGGARTTFDLLPGEGSFLRVAAPRPVPRTVRLRLRLGRHVSVRRRAVMRGPDPRRCGFGRFARLLGKAGDTRLLRVRRGSTDPDLTGADIVACQRGDAYGVSDEYSSLGGYSATTASTVTGGWAAVATHSEDHYGDFSVTVRLRSLQGAHEQRAVTIDFGDRSGPQPPPPDVDRLFVTAAGGLLVGQPAAPGAYTVRALDAAGDRVLDTGPGIPRASLALKGSAATWTRDGILRSAALDGAAPEG